MGVCIQRCDRIPMSMTDAPTLTVDKTGVGIIGANAFMGIHVVHTSYLRLGFPRKR